MKLTDEVATALAEKRPVVALESTLVAHGLPWPENFEVGRALEATVRERGAVPATIALVGGQINVGLSADDMEAMAKAGDKTWPKTSAADLAVRMARKQHGATTVSSTAYIAARAGIALFATGGIGGVHRGALDVSSDLTVLSKTKVAVVSAGMKAILDLPATLEVLETLGVPVLGYRTDELPAFYTQKSGLPLEHRLESPEEVALVLHHHFGLHDGGVLVANPIPKAHALDQELVDRAIDAALADAQAKGIRGKAITPHLLSYVSTATNKRSLGANRALAIANAELAADIAKSLVALS